MCIESAEKLSLVNSEKAISSVFLTQDNHINKWALRFSQDHYDDIKT